MKLRKDDPVYYKSKIYELIDQAQIEGLEVSINMIQESHFALRFNADNGDCAEVEFKLKK